MFLGIYRELEFSPGRHTSNDAKILRLVGQALKQTGQTIRLAPLEEARTLWKSAELIFSMCQGPSALAELAEWEKAGALIVNDPGASRRTYRTSLCRTLPQAGIAFPRSALIETDTTALETYEDFFMQGHAWLKRSDVHATGPGDVVRVNQFEDLPEAIRLFHGRGLASAFLQEHVQGDEVKFYAVQGDRFFWPFYPKESQGYPFDETHLAALAEAAAKTLQIHIYGGDAIISPEGAITLIDLNDWPSFAPCRGAAAHAIAHYLKDIYHANHHRRQTTTTAS